MAHRILALSLLLLGGTALAGWEPAGGTPSTCAFQARFAVLTGYPFARLEVPESGGNVVVPLTLQEEEPCKRARYVTAYPRSQRIPTYEVELVGLCQGSLPRGTVTQYLSGVYHRCALE